MEYTIHVEQFGKIKKAFIFGMGISHMDMHSLMFRGMENIEEYGESAVPCFHHLLKHQSRREMLSA